MVFASFFFSSLFLYLSSRCLLTRRWLLAAPQGARNEIFALRPAPIQVSYMGFCGTLGADYIDYMVVDR